MKFVLVALILMNGSWQWFRGDELLTKAKCEKAREAILVKHSGLAKCEVKKSG